MQRPRTTPDIEDINTCRKSGQSCNTCAQPCIGRADHLVPPESACDVILIGGGVVGCAIARDLSKYDIRVMLLEKDQDVASGASKANSGIIHGGYDAPAGTLKASLAFRGNRMFRQLDKELGFGYKECGSLVLAFTPDEVKVLQRLLENGQKVGVDGLSIIERAEIVAMEPHVHPKVLAALYCKHSGIVSPYELTISLAEHAAENGVIIKVQQEVVDIQREPDGRFSLRCNSGQSFSARFVVNAAGLSADKVAAMVGANDFVIRPRKGEYILLDKTQGPLAKHVLFPVPSPVFGKGVLVSPTYHGNLLLGPTSRDLSLPAERARSNEDVIHYILQQARRTMPGFDVARTITSYAGLRANSSRSDFIIEESRVKGFVNVAGIDSPGLTSSPAIAEMTVEILRRAGLQLPPKANWNPIWRPIFVPKPAGFHGSPTDPDPRRRVVCFCEQVTEGEIVDALHRRLPVLCTDGVKKRTRAGMGRCQGHRCEERVAEIISRETGIPLASVPRRGPGSSLLPHMRLTEVDKQVLAKL